MIEKAVHLANHPEPTMKEYIDDFLAGITKGSEPESVMTIALTPERKLARADVNEVLAAIEEQGFYLQMPPTAAEMLRRDGAGE